jgi:hypothetical protein
MTTKKRTAKRITYYSSLALSTMVEMTGAESETRAALERQLKAEGIDTTATRRNLPSGKTGELEAIARLIDLARANGLVVELVGRKAKGVSFRLITAGVGAILQSRHDN